MELPQLTTINSAANYQHFFSEPASTSHIFVAQTLPLHQGEQRPGQRPRPTMQVAVIDAEERAPPPLAEDGPKSSAEDGEIWRLDALRLTNGHLFGKHIGIYTYPYI